MHDQQRSTLPEYTFQLHVTGIDAADECSIRLQFVLGSLIFFFFGNKQGIYFYITHLQFELNLVQTLHLFILFICLFLIKFIYLFI